MSGPLVMHADTVQTPLQCPVCQASAVFAFTKREWRIWRCPACDFRFVWPAPPSTEAIYDEDYFRGAAAGFGYADYDEDKIAMESFFASVLATIRSFRSPPGALLDIGAATGFFLRMAQMEGWRGTGVEISSFACRRAHAAGLDVRCGTLETVSLPPGAFDAITLMDVLEHVSDPASMLARCRALLRPGGIIAINTPDASSAWARVFGTRWHAYCPPEHLSYFNATNAAALLRSTGFRPLAVRKFGKRFTPAYVFSMLARWQGIGFWDAASRWIGRTPLNRLALPVNIRDNFCIFAERSPDMAQREGAKTGIT